MALLHKILRTSVYIVDEDQDFIRTLKQLFARGIENYKIHIFPNANELHTHLTTNKMVRVQRNILVLPLSSRIGDRNGLLESIEQLRQILVNVHVLLTYNPGEIDKNELENFRVERLVEDVIVKNNFARLHIQNAIRRVLSHDDFILRRKLLFLSGIITLSFFIITLILFFL